MKIFQTMILVAVLAVAAVATFAQANRPVDAVKSFYAFDKVHSKAFTRASIDARKKWFSGDLYKLFLYELKRQREFERKNPNEKPYFGEGLPFRPYDELCTVGKRSLHKQLSFMPDVDDTVIVTFAFAAPCTDPDATPYKLKMVKSGGSWVIDNVIYDTDSSLVADLKRKDY